MGILGYYIVVTLAVTLITTLIAVYAAVAQLEKDKTKLNFESFEKRQKQLVAAGSWAGLKAALIWPYLLFTHLRDDILEELQKEESSI